MKTFLISVVSSQPVEMEMPKIEIDDSMGARDKSKSKGEDSLLLSRDLVSSSFSIIFVYFLMAFVSH